MRTLGTKLFTSGLLATTIIAASSVAALAEDKRIAFFVSDLSNVFHQSQAAEAQRYAAEKYGAEVVVFDGQADSAVMTQNIDQVLAGGFDARRFTSGTPKRPRQVSTMRLAKGSS